MFWKYLRIALEIYFTDLALLGPVMVCIMRVGSRSACREEYMRWKEEDERRFGGDKIIYRS